MTDLIQAIIISAMFILAVYAIFKPLTTEEMKELGFTDDEIAEYKESIKIGN